MTQAYTNFLKSYNEDGKPGERAALAWLCQKSKFDEITDVRVGSEYKNKAVDFIGYTLFDEDNCHIEVKNDKVMSGPKKTGNLAIEMLTDMDKHIDGWYVKGIRAGFKRHWIIYRDAVLQFGHIINLWDIKDYIENNYCREVPSKDTDNLKISWNKLIPLEKFKEKYKVCTVPMPDTSEEELAEIVQNASKRGVLFN